MEMSTEISGNNSDKFGQGLEYEISNQIDQEELGKLATEGLGLSQLLVMYPNINPEFLNSKFVEYKGNLEKITDFIENMDSKETENNVSSGNNLQSEEQVLESGIGGNSNCPGDILLQQTSNMEVKLKSF